MSLYEQINLAAQIREQLASMAIEDEALIRDTIEGECDIFECIDWLLAKIADEKGTLSAIDSRVESLQIRGERAHSRVEKWRGLIQQAMGAIGEKTVKRPEATITLAPKSVGIQSIDESQVPDEFFITEIIRKLDKKKLKEAALASGVSGVLLDNGGMTLRIRT